MKKPTVRRFLLGTGAILFASISGAALFNDLPRQASAQADDPAPPPVVTVSVATVEPRDVAIWEEFSGRLEAVDHVDVRPRVAGQIRSAHFREGALVKKGDLLVTVDPDLYAVAVQRAEALVRAARARVELTRLELERGRKLAETRTVSQSDLDQRLNAYREAEANQKSAEAALAAARLDLGYTEIRAPISGRAGKLEITEGNLVAAGAGSPVLLKLVSVDPIYASFSLGEQLVARILAKLPVTKDGIRAVDRVPVEIRTAGGDGAAIRGRLQLIDNEVDAASGTVRARAVFDNADGRLIPGQFVRVRVGQPEPEPELVISERAVGTDQDKKFVLVVGADNTVAYREVALGAFVENLRIVESGLEPGERIVVNGLQRVRPGTVVDPEQVAMNPVDQALVSATVTEQ